MARLEPDIFLPVPLSAWDIEAIEIHRAVAKDGGSIESAELPESEGADLFAIEDGVVLASPADNFISLSSDADKSRGWRFLNAQLASGLDKDGSQVRAGDKIGTVSGGDLVFMGLSGDDIVNPIDALDDLNAVALPQDQKELLSPAERRLLSERLTGGVDLKKAAKIGGLIAGGVLLGALTVKAFSK